MADKTDNVVPLELGEETQKPETEVSNEISDAQFIEQISRLKTISNFLSLESIPLPLSESEASALGTLFTLTYQERGRLPAAGEWAMLLKFNRLLFQPLSDEQRRRLLLGGVSAQFARLPLMFAGIAFLALVACVITPNFYSGPMDDNKYKIAVLPFYIIWLMSMGAVGSIAFIGMNALSVQEDITFDLLNPRLINLRIALGSTFSLVLALPLAHEGFMKFLDSILLLSSKPEDRLSSADSFILVLPFLLGFSTSLVIVILNRFIDAAHSFFGQSSTKRPPKKKP